MGPSSRRKDARMPVTALTCPRSKYRLRPSPLVKRKNALSVYAALDACLPSVSAGLLSGEL